MTKKEYMRIYYATHREVMDARAREYYKTHPESRRAAQKRYRERHPLTIEQRMALSERRRSRYNNDEEYREKKRAKMREYQARKRAEREASKNG